MITLYCESSSLWCLNASTFFTGQQCRPKINQPDKAALRPPAAENVGCRIKNIYFTPLDMFLSFLLNLLACIHFDNLIVKASIKPAFNYACDSDSLMSMTHARPSTKGTAVKQHGPSVL